MTAPREGRLRGEERDDQGHTGPYDDLRQWIARLRAEGELLEISAPVDPHLELGAVCRYFLDNPPQRALLFTNVTGHSQPVLANVFGTRRRLDLALGTTDGNREQFVLDP